MAKQESPQVQGTTDPGFEGVRVEFERNLRERRELGAAFAVSHRGRLVVDLWGGHCDRQRMLPWQRDTVTTVFSTTKGVSALVLALLHSRGLLEWDAPVARYWPEFAQAGKQDVTVRQLGAHQAGLSGIDVRLDEALLSDFDRLAVVLAKQRPAWEPGTRHGYHGISLGWYQSELVRRIDPQGRSLGRYFQDELAKPLGLDFQIGLPSDFPERRLAEIHPAGIGRSLSRLRAPNAIPPRMIAAMLNPRSHTGRAFGNPRLRSPADINRIPWMRQVEIPSANGVGDARSLARLYGEFATGGAELGLSKQTLEDLMADPIAPSGGIRDLVLCTDTNFSLGFMKARDGFDFASSRKAFGTPGAGGSFGFADPDARVGMAYIMNRMDSYLVDDPREMALRDAAYRSLAKVGPGH